MTGDSIGLRVADLGIWLEAAGTGVGVTVPPCFYAFIAGETAGAGLTLRVADGTLSSTEGWQPVMVDDNTWQFWRDDAGRHVFVAARSSLPRQQVVVGRDFRAGVVTGDFGASMSAGQPVYPLQDVDIALFVNWLAVYGDLIVHAAGIDDDGAGYAFVGPSGAGKSTLADQLAAHSAITVLGEDQVIVRWKEGRFLVYGTPWHTNPARCSPGGVPLKKLFFLDRTRGRGIEPCGRLAGIERLLQDAFIPYYDRSGVTRILDRLALLAEQVPFYLLSYRLGDDVLTLIHHA